MHFRARSSGLIEPPAPARPPEAGLYEQATRLAYGLPYKGPTTDWLDSFRRVLKREKAGHAMTPRESVIYSVLAVYKFRPEESLEVWLARASIPQIEKFVARLGELTWEQIHARCVEQVAVIEEEDGLRVTREKAMKVFETIVDEIVDSRNDGITAPEGALDATQVWRPSAREDGNGHAASLLPDARGYALQAKCKSREHVKLLTVRGLEGEDVPDDVRRALEVGAPLTMKANKAKREAGAKL